MLENNGMECWMAPMSIPAGSSYAIEIPQAIKSCSAFVLLLSENSQNSKWVPKEVDTALGYERIVIPFHVDESDINEQFNFRLTDVQRVEAFNRRSEAYRELVERLRPIVENPGLYSTPSDSKSSGAEKYNAKTTAIKDTPYGRVNRQNSGADNKQQKNKGRLFAILGLCIAGIAVALLLFFVINGIVKKIGNIKENGEKPAVTDTATLPGNTPNTDPNTNTDASPAPGLDTGSEPSSGTPSQEMVGTAYFYSDKNGTRIVTLSTDKGNGTAGAVWQSFSAGGYSRINLTGKIMEKNSDGGIKIVWTGEESEVLPEGTSWTPVGSSTVSGDETTFSCGELEMTAFSDDSYMIRSADDLLKLVNSDGIFVLANDIDLGGTKRSPIAGFSGVLAGNGFTISNLKIESASGNAGLFSDLAGFVADLKIENASVTVTGKSENVGILCGVLSGNATGISVSGVVRAEKSEKVGGVTGWAQRTTPYDDMSLTNFSSDAEVHGEKNVGGIAGYISGEISDFRIADSLNRGAVTASGENAGGIAGSVEVIHFGIVIISNSRNTGDISGKYNVGGIVGSATSKDREASKIDTCACSATVKGEAFAGCIAGCLTRIRVDECSNKGATLEVTGYYVEDNKHYAYAGGFVGLGSSVFNCTNEVEVNYSGNGGYVGGIIGCAYSETDTIEIRNVANNMKVSGEDYVGGIAGYVRGYYADILFEKAENHGDVTARGNYAGGIAGNCNSNDFWGTTFYLYDSFNENAVNGKKYVGGLFGVVNFSFDDEGHVVTGCNSTGEVSGESDTGKLVGYSHGVSFE